MAGKWSTGEYQRAAPRIVAAANANPNHRCPLCDMTLAEAVAAGMARPAWECGHPEPPITYRYAAWHGTCNRSHGAAKGNRARRRRHQSAAW